ncbi:hypothetical protein BU14_2234s0001, partial [Porphyra umbilicalis]
MSSSGGRPSAPRRGMEGSLRRYEPDMKSAMVTCATNALGLATTRMLLLSGFRVVMQDANVEALNDA